jgi:hypothetical protein
MKENRYLKNMWRTLRLSGHAVSGLVRAQERWGRSELQNGKRLCTQSDIVYRRRLVVLVLVVKPRLLT